MKLVDFLKTVKLRDVLLLIAILYMILWYLDDRKAKGIFWSVADTGTQFLTWSLAIQDTRSTAGVKSTNRSQLRHFLQTPNAKLLELREGFYDKPAEYYIHIDENGRCKANYSKKFRGRWLTPAKVLCPQVKPLIKADAKGMLTIPIRSGCQDNPVDAKRRGWACE